ncbi:MAG: short-chain dehydrogenase [Acidimicrobiia bacterium]|nr:MAG: short-chain dehydrogenase [Acidimicrobiia bacterium]
MNLTHVASFTNLGYHLHVRGRKPVSADMSGRTVVITGATSGLGLATARALAGLGARTILVGRNEERLRRVADLVGGETIPMRADLSLMSDIRALAAELPSEIHVLVNNVGVLLPERAVTEEGIEATLATNLAGHFLLTNLLAARLVASAPSRVINVTSGGMYAERIRPDDLQSERGRYRGAVTYARTKRGQVILTEMWAHRLAGTGVTVHAMHPGWARTSGVARSLPMFNRLMGPLLRTPEQGADTIVWLASSPEAAESSGLLWFDRQPVPTHLRKATRETESDRRKLWQALVELTDCDLDLPPRG